MKLYGETSTDKLNNDIAICREIVKKILDFGVSQDQILKIVHLLSLELESRQIMVELTDVTKRHMTNIGDSEIEQTKLTY